MKTTITIELDVETGRLGVFAPMETTEQREMTATVLATAIQVTLQHRPKKIITPPTPAIITPKNGTPLTAA